MLYLYYKRHPSNDYPRFNHYVIVVTTHPMDVRQFTEDGQFGQTTPNVPEPATKVPGDVIVTVANL